MSQAYRAYDTNCGSTLKIDASYLSPNVRAQCMRSTAVLRFVTQVNMSARMEAATGQFGVDLLFSEDVYKLLPPLTQSMPAAISVCA